LSDFSQAVFKDALDRSFIRLTLPAVEIRPVITERELIVLHVQLNWGLSSIFCPRFSDEAVLPIAATGLNILIIASALILL